MNEVACISMLGCRLRLILKYIKIYLGLKGIQDKEKYSGESDIKRKVESYKKFQCLYHMYCSM